MELHCTLESQNGNQRQLSHLYLTCLPKYWKEGRQKTCSNVNGSLDWTVKGIW